MARTFSTELSLYDNIPITDGLNISFSSLDAQRSYFAAQPKHTFPAAYSFVRHTQGYVDVGMDFGDCLMKNYLSFTNNAHTPVTFYCRVTDVEYINEATTRVHFSVDAWQTFMFDHDWRPSYIERQHPTAAEQVNIDQDPYRRDLFYLYSNENLPTTPDLYMDGKKIRGKITDQGGPAGDPRNDDRVLDPPGNEDIVKQLGGSDFSLQRPGTPAPPFPTEIVFLVAHFAELHGTVIAAALASGGDAAGLATIQINPPDEEGDNYLAGHDLVVVRGDFAGQDVEKAMAAVSRAFLDKMTENGTDSAIVAAYLLPSGFSDVVAHTNYVEGVDVDSGPDSTTNYGAVVGYEPVMKKLYRSPFRTVKVTSPTGEEHSYAFEESNVYHPTQNGKRISFVLWRLTDDIPSQVVAPARFKGSSVHLVDKMVFSSYPQLSYTTDGFLTYMAAQYQNTITTTSTKDRVMGQTGIPEIGSAIQAGGTRAASGIANAAAGVADFFGFDGTAENLRGGAEDLNMMGEADKNDENMAQRTIEYMRGDRAENPLGHHADAFTLDHYHAGNAANSIHTRTSNDWWTVEVRTLQGPVLRAYDEYLQLYGYTFNSMGIPHVVARRVGHDDPLFIDGNTYVKTSGAKVHGIPDQYARQIAGMFDGGIRMINGG